MEEYFNNLNEEVKRVNKLITQAKNEKLTQTAIYFLKLIVV